MDVDAPTAGTRRTPAKQAASAKKKAAPVEDVMDVDDDVYVVPPPAKANIVKAARGRRGSATSGTSAPSSGRARSTDSLASDASAGRDVHYQDEHVVMSVRKGKQSVGNGAGRGREAPAPAPAPCVPAPQPQPRAQLTFPLTFGATAAYKSAPSDDSSSDDDDAVLNRVGGVFVSKPAQPRPSVGAGGSVAGALSPPPPPQLWGNRSGVHTPPAAPVPQGLAHDFQRGRPVAPPAVASRGQHELYSGSAQGGVQGSGSKPRAGSRGPQPAHRVPIEAKAADEDDDDDDEVTVVGAEEAEVHELYVRSSDQSLSWVARNTAWAQATARRVLKYIPVRWGSLALLALFVGILLLSLANLLNAGAEERVVHRYKAFMMEALEKQLGMYECKDAATPVPSLSEVELAKHACDGLDWENSLPDERMAGVRSACEKAFKAIGEEAHISIVGQGAANDLLWAASGHARKPWTCWMQEGAVSLLSLVWNCFVLLLSTSWHLFRAYPLQTISTVTVTVLTTRFVLYKRQKALEEEQMDALLNTAVDVLITEAYQKDSRGAWPTDLLGEACIDRTFPDAARRHTQRAAIRAKIWPLALKRLKEDKRFQLESSNIDGHTKDVLRALVRSPPGLGPRRTSFGSIQAAAAAAGGAPAQQIHFEAPPAQQYQQQAYMHVPAHIPAPVPVPPAGPVHGHQPTVGYGLPAVAHAHGGAARAGLPVGPPASLYGQAAPSAPGGRPSPSSGLGSMFGSVMQVLGVSPAKGRKERREYTPYI